MATRTITGTIYDGQGNPVSGAKASFVMDRGTYLLDPDVHYAATSVTAVSNGTGEFSVELEAGLPVLWNVSLPSQTFVIAVPEGLAITLEELRASFSGTVPERVPGDPPTVTDFTNMQHAHISTVTGGTLPSLAISTALGFLPQRVFNVTSPLYGATGDGTTDDSVAVTAAITAANAAGGGVVYFPEGTYVVTGALGSTATNVTVKGDGRFISKLKLKASANTHVFDITGNNWHFEDIGIDGNRANNVSGHGIRIAGDHHSMDRVYIHDTPGYGIGNSQGDSDSLRYADYRNVYIFQPGTDGLEMKDKNSLNVGNRFTDITIVDWDQSATGDCAGIDCRGMVQLANIVCIGGASTNGSAIRFREDSPTTGPLGARKSSLTNALIMGNGTTSSYGISANTHDVNIDNVVVVDMWRGVTDTSTSERVAFTNVTVLNGFSRGFDINSDEGATLTNCRAQGCVVGFNIAGDDVTLTNCRSDDHTNTGLQLVGARPIVTGFRPKATGGTGVSVNVAAVNARISRGDFTGQSGGTKLSDSSTSTVATENIAVNDIGAGQAIIYTMDGSGVAIATGAKGFIGPLGYAATITGWTLTSDVSCSAVVDVWKDTLANHPPVVGDVITASAKPTLTTAVQNSSTTLTGWTTAIGATDTLRFNVNSNDNATLLTLQLAVTRTR